MLDAATEKQMAYIAILTAKAGLGNYASQGIKHVLGKNPIGGLSKGQASRIIEALKQKETP